MTHVRAAITACRRSECFVVPFKKVTHTIVSLISSSPSALVERSALFPHIWKVPGSNVGPKTAYLMCFVVFLVTAGKFWDSSCNSGKPGWRSRYSGSQRDGRSGYRIPWGLDFPCRPDRARGPPSLLYNVYHILPGVNLSTCGVDHPPPSGAEVMNGLELQHRLPSVPT